MYDKQLVPLTLDNDSRRRIADSLAPANFAAHST